MTNFAALTRQIINVSIYLLAAIAIFVVVVIIISLLLKYLRVSRIRSNSKRLSYFEIKLPENDESRAANAEQMFANLSNMEGIESFGDKLFGSDSFVSFEIFASFESIRFFVVCPTDIADIVSRTINAAYSKAEISPVKEFSIFQMQNSKFFRGHLLLTNKQVFEPIKTHSNFSTDTMAAFLENMSDLKEGEALTMQIVINPIDEKWRIAGKMYLDELNKTSSTDKRRDDLISGVNEKITKIGFGTEIKLIAAAATRARAEQQLRSVVSSFGQFANPGQNSFRIGRPHLGYNAEYTHRYPLSSIILNTAELSTIFHFPNNAIKVPHVQWLNAVKGAASNLIPSENGQDYMWLGQAVFRDQRQDVFMKPEDRMRHMYVVGQTGTGKSKFIAGCCLRDIKMGHGTAFIDPHGSDTEWIIERIPKERMQDVIIIDPSDLENPIGMNMMEFDKPEQKTLIINDMLSIFDKLYDLKLTGGPIFEQYMRNAMLLVMSDPASGSTILEIPRVLSDAGFREYKLQHCQFPEVVRFWKEEAMKVEGEASLANLVPYITSKLSTFLYNDFIRPMVVQQKSTVNFREAIDSKKIILIKLSKGLVGEINSNFLGMIILGKLLMAALSREDTDEKDRHPFYLYIDEFQNFLTDSVYSILSEARKYQLSLTVAHQFINQLAVKGDTRIRDAVFGNVGSRVYMRVGTEDADFIAKDLQPHFNASDVQNQSNGWAYTKLLVDGSYPPPFTMHTWFGNSKFDMITDANPIEMTTELMNQTRKKYGRSKAEIEAEVAERNKFKAEVADTKNPYAGLLPPADKLAKGNNDLLAAFGVGQTAQPVAPADQTQVANSQSSQIKLS